MDSLKDNGHDLADAKAIHTPDAYGRRINYLRISVTDRCNLRCVYCMSPEEDGFLPREDLLTAAEIETVVRAAVAQGFCKFRLTGGEPTLRPDLVEIIGRLARIPGVDDLGITTNAIRLPSLANDLARAGLRRVNIHMDTLDAEHLPWLMRRSRFEKIWAGIQAAEAAGLVPIKINAVVVRGFNEKDAVAMAGLTLERDWIVRFIELMPLGDGEMAQLAIDHYVSNQETKRRIEAVLGPLTPIPTKDRADEARNFRLPGGRGIVGFINPVSHPYCDTCNRMRLTADGKFKHCLLHDGELDVKQVIRQGGSLEDVERFVEEAKAIKPLRHALEFGIRTKKRHMFQVGG